MIRNLVMVAVAVLIGVVAFALLAQLAPEGSWLNDAGESMADGFKTWWKYPFGS
jgi:hypothetical protein